MTWLEWFKDLLETAEWKMKHPDPLIVCPKAVECVHMDGYLCDPHTCKECNNDRKRC